MPDLSAKEEAARHGRRSTLPQALPPGPQRPGLPAYTELHAITNFSFQRGASHPEELAVHAWSRGYCGLAITDECSVAGVVRAMVGLKEFIEDLDELERKEPERPKLPRNPDFRLLYGSEFRLERYTLVALARDLKSWGQLCETITAARTQDEVQKGRYQLEGGLAALAALRDCELLFVPHRHSGAPIDIDTLVADLRAVAEQVVPPADPAQPDEEAPPGLWLAVELHHELDDDLWLAALQQAGERSGVPCVAAGGVRMHVRSRKPLLDVLTAVDLGRPVAECGLARAANAERHLRSRMRLARTYPAQLLARTMQVRARCGFSLEALRKHYQYPLELVEPNETAAQTLRRKTWAGAQQRYPGGVPESVQVQVRRELDLIIELGYEMFFLTVEDIVAFAREKKILCQGRGSSANSAVCYCLGITALAPDDANLLFERFLSRERKEPPDIDVDFEHQRREEVIQYIYGKYGRERAAIAAVVIAWRTRSAIRDVGKALGVDARLIDAFAKDHHWFDSLGPGQEASAQSVMTEGVIASLQQAMDKSGAVAPPHKLHLWVELARTLRGFPRHLSQHVGGFVLTEGRLTSLVPVENASMKDRSVIQWDKDDLEAMGMLKVDVLALGMLSAIRRALRFMNDWRGTQCEMHQLPNDDEATYDMICAADTIGVFQIESRAQMSMLPRLRPRCYYDLVVEVAIVRPGPIHGGMVHPYLKQRERQRRGDPIVLAKEELDDALGRTLGVPIFQEQVMQIAMIAAGFTADEADRLRRAMAAWKKKGGIDRFHDQLVEGMVARDYDRAFAEAIFKQCEGFGEYGFPESHAASFALLVTVSAWLKCHEPACFLAALLDSQPMGFYTPSQLVQDARRHGVQVRPVDVMASEWDSTLEPRTPGFESPQLEPRHAARQGRQQGRGQPAVRLGLSRIEGLSQAGAQRLIEARAQQPFCSVEDLALRAALDSRDMAALAGAEALRALAGHRRQQVWEATGPRVAGTGRQARPRAGAPAPPPATASLLREVPVHEAPLQLPLASEGEEIVGDYAAMGFTLRRHPLALLRPRLARLRLLSARELEAVPHGRTVRACGIVTVRQRPGTAKGTIFVTLEDETGPVNVIVWPGVVEAWRVPLLQSQLLAVQGQWQCAQNEEAGGGQVRHLIAARFKDLTPWLGQLAKRQRSRDFH
ncbi:error-prone DNA polymerase [Xenophilus arseniciresistens]|uniref:Error-prone DNA polymerase n=1 Tax=Xenophilus arseniciresistens TaxID=1283306 RepID=A0AAE3T1E6_9BURK|nr:error-prone DNA polymerase [Xenophilus arseniciresistens]MDA7417292.1 error-prone DNA polymerase [Xenophilus arseniciresistens]